MKKWLMRIVLVGVFIFTGMSIDAQPPRLNADKDTTSVLQPWSKILDQNKRFELVLGANAVLDNETGLVWERYPSNTPVNWAKGCKECYGRTVGDRKGWRPPTVDELLSLFDNKARSRIKLPRRAPFRSPKDKYWAISPIGFAWEVSLISGGADTIDSNANRYIWCVRGRP